MNSRLQCYRRFSSGRCGCRLEPKRRQDATGRNWKRRKVHRINLFGAGGINRKRQLLTGLNRQLLGYLTIAYRPHQRNHEFIRSSWTLIMYINRHNADGFVVEIQ